VFVVKGHVDESRRALIDVQIANTPSRHTTAVTVWIDTAFDGFLVFPKNLIDQLGLHQEALASAILADGSHVLLESYVCHVNWFGEIVTAQVIANEGKLPLLGTEFLAHRKLMVDYALGTVSID
jgi:clan AA aspartic protease